MTIEEVVVSALASIAKAHPNVMPSGSAVPCIVYQMISGPSDFAEHVTPRFQLACWASSYGGAVTLGDAVRNAMHQKHATVSGLHYHSMVVNEMDGNSEPDVGLFCRIVDVKFFYQKPLT